MRDVPNRSPRLWSPSPLAGLLAALGLALAWSAPAFAGKLSWLDDVVREVVREAEAGGKAAVRVGGDGASTAVRGSTRLFTREASCKSGSPGSSRATRIRSAPSPHSRPPRSAWSSR